MRPFPISLHTARLTLRLPDDQGARAVRVARRTKPRRLTGLSVATRTR
jgi:hypothetical protein